MSDKVIISRVLNAVLMQETIPQGTHSVRFHINYRSYQYNKNDQTSIKHNQFDDNFNFISMTQLAP